MNIELTRSEVYGLIAACRDRKHRLDQDFHSINDPTPGAMARSEIDRIEKKLRILLISKPSVSLPPGAPNIQPS